MGNQLSDQQYESQRSRINQDMDERLEELRGGVTYQMLRENFEAATMPRSVIAGDNTSDLGEDTRRVVTFGPRSNARTMEEFYGGGSASPVSAPSEPESGAVPDTAATGGSRLAATGDFLLDPDMLNRRTGTWYYV